MAGVFRDAQVYFIMLRTRRKNKKPLKANISYYAISVVDSGRLTWCGSSGGRSTYLLLRGAIDGYVSSVFVLIGDDCTVLCGRFWFGQCAGLEPIIISGVCVWISFRHRSWSLAIRCFSVVIGHSSLLVYCFAMRKSILTFSSVVKLFCCSRFAVSIFCSVVISTRNYLRGARLFKFGFD